MYGGSLEINKTQIEIILNLPFLSLHPNQMASSGKQVTTNSVNDVGEKKVWWECKLVQPVEKSVRKLLKKPKEGLRTLQLSHF